MKEKKTILEMKEKKKYVSPLIKVSIIEMECCIAAGSGTTKPENGGVTEEWGVDKDDDATVDW
ncbi:hypothetical protein CQS02_02870 [Elizabethkingia miricola]|nr:hypothetical protein CQS02_02870 [Elizabethkingia miricola]